MLLQKKVQSSAGRAANKPCYNYSDNAILTNSLIYFLQSKEKDKFECKGHTNKKTGISMTGEDIMKDHNSRQYGFLPAVVSPYGQLGNIIERFLFGGDTYPLPSFGPTKPHAKRAAEIATSVVVPDGILKQADKIWREQHPGETYGRNYKEMTPSVSACQKLGQLDGVCRERHTHTERH